MQARSKQVPGTLLLPFAIAALVLCGCPARQTSVQVPSAAIAATTDTSVGPADVFTIDVFGEKELSGKFRVSAQGTIDYPLVGSVKVAGLTPPEIAKVLRDRLAKGFLKEPYVSVFVDTYNSKKISVFGQVSKPGTFTYVYNMSIIEAITLAGGLTAIAAKNSITVTRIENGKKYRINVPVEDIGEGRASNYLVKAGDIIFVPERLF
jgi:polysaccharide export outer membrane protein